MRLFDTHVRPDLERYRSRRDDGMDVLPIIWIIPVVALKSLVIRVWSTLRFLADGIRSMPANWRTAIFETDMKKPLELVPGTGALDLRYDEMSGPFSFENRSVILGAAIFGVVVWAARNIDRFESSALVEGLMWFCFIVAAFSLFVSVLVMSIELVAIVCAFWWRWSIKTTAFIWAPLAYLCKPGVDLRLSLKERVEIAIQSNIERKKEILAVFTLIIHAAIFLLLPTIMEVDPEFSVHLWQLAATANALIFLSYRWSYLPRAAVLIGRDDQFADDVRGRMDNTERALRFIGGYSLLCFFLTLYDIGVFHAFITSFDLRLIPISR
jgi:hypothetical protein